jgi:hypothetical protein
MLLPFHIGRLLGQQVQAHRRLGAELGRANADLAGLNLRLQRMLAQQRDHAELLLAGAGGMDARAQRCLLNAVGFVDNHDALKLEKLGMSVILALIIMVAAFNIVSTLTMVVRDKTREIGILKAMGMRADSIRRIFLLQGAFIGAVGTGFGLALGLGTGFALERWKLIALDPAVYFIDHLPVRLEVFEVSLIVLLSIGVAVLATLHPARTAANLYPIEAIRSE